MRITEVTERCINLLVSLLSSKNETVVAESIVVMKQLLQMPNLDPQQHKDVIKQLARLLETVTNPRARASIVWVVGEYVSLVIQYAPDILRQLAKGYKEEDTIVRIQILNLAGKLYVVEKEKTNLIVLYVLQLAKYDTNYDIRDKSRILRHILFNPEQKTTILQSNAKELFASEKPAPVVEKIESRYRVGSSSHIVNHSVNSYHPVYDWCVNPPPSTIRDVVNEQYNDYNDDNLYGYDEEYDEEYYDEEFYDEEYYDEEYDEEYYDEEYYDEEYNEEYDEEYDEKLEEKLDDTKVEDYDNTDEYQNFYNDQQIKEEEIHKNEYVSLNDEGNGVNGETTNKNDSKNDSKDNSKDNENKQL
jgi:AP-3 complex subunit beta